MIITIDGPAGSGKSTIAKKLAEKLGFDFFDTGAMYRSFTWWFIENSMEIEDDEGIKNLLKTFDFEIKNSTSCKKYFVNNTDITSFIRSSKINNLVSKISTKSYVRKHVVKIQRSYAKNINSIFEGRDMGTVVFPFADIKFFLTADIKIRAKRRFLEMNEKISYDEIFNKLKERDSLDSNRKTSPLCRAKDASKIDTSKLMIEKVINKIFKIVKKEIKKTKTTVPNFFKMKFLYGIILFFTFSFFKIFYRLKVYGIHNFKKGPAIIASNHVSYYDPPVVAVSSKEEINFFAKSSLFKLPILGRLIEKLNAHPVSKETQNIFAMKQILRILKKGKKIIFFPEGKRSKTGDISKIMPGIGYFVYMSKCLIIPTYVYGTYEIWKKDKKFPKLFGKIRCVFGTPINPNDFDCSDKKKFIFLINDELYKKLFLIKQWCDNGFIGSPP